MKTKLEERLFTYGEFREAIRATHPEAFLVVDRQELLHSLSRYFNGKLKISPKKYRT